jgi:hypothetical protein
MGGCAGIGKKHTTMEFIVSQEPKNQEIHDLNTNENSPYGSNNTNNKNKFVYAKKNQITMIKIQNVNKLEQSRQILAKLNCGNKQFK